MKKRNRIALVVAGVLTLGAILSGTAVADDNCEPVYEERSYWLPSYNGNSSDDWSYDSGDYRPECTGTRDEPKSNGYSGYVGSDDSRYEDDNFRLGLD